MVARAGSDLVHCKLDPTYELRIYRQITPTQFRFVSSRTFTVLTDGSVRT